MLVGELCWELIFIGNIKHIDESFDSRKSKNYIELGKIEMRSEHKKYWILKKEKYRSLFRSCSNFKKVNGINRKVYKSSTIMWLVKK